MDRGSPRPDSIRSHILTGISDLNDHYYLAEEEFDIEIQGQMSIEFDLSSIPEGQTISENIPKLLPDANISIIEIEDIAVVIDDHLK